MQECNNNLSDLEVLLLKYPGLLHTQNKNNETCLKGPVKIKDVWLHINLICPNYPQLHNFQLRVQQSFNIKTLNSENLNISPGWLVEDLIENLPAILKNNEEFSNLVQAYKQEDLQTNIYAEIANLYAPTEYEMLVNDKCTLVRFQRFVLNEQHFLEVSLPSLQLLDHSLPSCIEWSELFAKATTLTMVLQQFRQFLDSLQPFYENFTDIDELCHVVQPPLPTTKANWRLFVLKEKVFIKLQFTDPFAPLSSMSVHIIGPTAEVTQLRRVYSEGLRDWDGELDVHKNLLRIFDLCFFPMTPAEGSQSNLQFCNICYCYKLEHGEIPIVSCDNNQCSLIYHAVCLKEWFKTLADGKTFLDVSLGACPFCKAKLSTSFQEILD